MTANSMIRSIHAARTRAGMREEEFRDWLERDYGTRHISELGALNCQAALKVLNGKADAVAKPTGRRRLSGPYAPKLQALWLSAWNLGIVRNKADEAMLAFVERQTSIARTEFLRAAKDARKAVEGLKSWIAREGGVDWSRFEDPQDAVIAAQMRKLGTTIGEYADLEKLGKVELMQALGERIRRAK